MQRPQHSQLLRCLSEFTAAVCGGWINAPSWWGEGSALQEQHFQVRPATCQTAEASWLNRLVLRAPSHVLAGALLPLQRLVLSVNPSHFVEASRCRRSCCSCHTLVLPYCPVLSKRCRDLCTLLCIKTHRGSSLANTQPPTRRPLPAVPPSGSDRGGAQAAPWAGRGSGGVGPPAGRSPGGRRGRRGLTNRAPQRQWRGSRAVTACRALPWRQSMRRFSSRCSPNPMHLPRWTARAPFRLVWFSTQHDTQHQTTIINLRMTFRIRRNVVAVPVRTTPLQRCTWPAQPCITEHGRLPVSAPRGPSCPCQGGSAAHLTTGAGRQAAGRVEAVGAAAGGKGDGRAVARGRPHPAVPLGRKLGLRVQLLARGGGGGSQGISVSQSVSQSGAVLLQQA